MLRISGAHTLLMMAAALAVTGCQDQPTQPTSTSALPDQPSRLVISSPRPFIALSVAIIHSCAVSTAGVVECWGLDAPATVYSSDPSHSSFTHLAASSEYTCGLRDDEAVQCWGNLSMIQPPPEVPNGYVQIGGGRDHTCAVRNSYPQNPFVECWGRNTYGQAPATKVAGTGSFTQVDGGFYHSCALRNDGVVECWGSGGAGAAPATRNALIGGFVQVSAGHDHTCALRDDGAVECWGSDGQGQAPASKAAMSGVFTQVSAGGGHTCALRNDGVVECWGAQFSSDFGQAPPTKTAAYGAFIDVEAGELHTCALRSDGIVECWGYNGEGAAPATRASTFIETTNVPPAATFSAPVSVVAGTAFSLALNNAHVPGYSGSVTFSFRFDCGDGTGYGAFGTSSTASCLTSAIGTRSVKGIIRDQDGDLTEYTGSVPVIYAFGGFTGPVDAPPMVNLAKAGSAIPVKFSLGGNQGMAILAAGYPVSQQTGCSASSSTDPIEQTVTAGSSSLSYDSGSGLYSYTWKTDKTWGGTCRRLTIRLADGREYIALFQFN